jgi:hypothetical protein
MRKPLALFMVLCISVAITILMIKVSVQESAEVLSPPCTEELTTSIADITSIALQIASKDLDSDGNPDGFIVYITFLDKRGTPVRFEDTKYRIRVTIFEAVKDSHGAITKGELLFDFCCPPITKTTSSEVEQQGIEILLNLSEPDQLGIIEVEVEIPGVGVFHAVKEGVPLS